LFLGRKPQPRISVFRITSRSGVNGRSSSLTRTTSRRTPAILFCLLVVACMLSLPCFQPGHSHPHARSVFYRVREHELILTGNPREYARESEMVPAPGGLQVPYSCTGRPGISHVLRFPTLPVQKWNGFSRDANSSTAWIHYCAIVLRKRFSRTGNQQGVADAFF
jgi:hypothetical protein